LKSHNFCFSETILEKNTLNNNNNDQSFYGFLITAVAVGILCVYSYYITPPDVLPLVVEPQCIEKPAIEVLKTVSYQKIFEANPYDQKMPPHFFFPQTRFF